MEITIGFLHQKGACKGSYKWVVENKLIGLEHEEFIDKLMKNNRFSDANWLITKLFDETQGVKYAIFAAEQVIDIFEKKYPDDKRPRKAIEAAKDYLKSPNDVTYAADAAYDAADDAADAAAYAADAAAYAATAADAADDAAAYVGDAAAYAAYAADAADAAAGAYNAADVEAVETPIINYGLELLK
jgi:hypothetical protein